MPISQGILIGLAVYLHFINCKVSPLVVPASIVAAWLGDIVYLFSPSLLHEFGSGVDVRIKSIVFVAYFINLAILIVIMRFSQEQIHSNLK